MWLMCLWRLVGCPSAATLGFLCSVVVETRTRELFIDIDDIVRIFGIVWCSARTATTRMPLARLLALFTSGDFPRGLWSSISGWHGCRGRVARLVEVNESRDQDVGSYIASQHHTYAYSASRQLIVSLFSFTQLHTTLLLS